MAKIIRTDQAWILELLKMFGAMRMKQATELLKLKFPNATLDRTIQPLLQGRQIKQSDGYLFSRSGKIDDRIIEAIDIMLLIGADISQGLKKGNGDPVTLTFFKERENKLWCYDIIPIPYGTEVAISEKLEGTNRKYRMIVFVPETEEQMHAVKVTCDHCYVVKTGDEYDFYRYMKEAQE